MLLKSKVEFDTYLNNVEFLNLRGWVLSLVWEDPLKKGKTTHSSVLAWSIPGMGEPGGLPSMGSHRVGHD